MSDATVIAVPTPTPTGETPTSAPLGIVLYFHTDRASAKLTLAGLRLAGYRVQWRHTTEGVHAYLSDLAEGTAQRPCAIVIDAIGDVTAAEQVATAVQTSPAAGDIPRILLVDRDNPEPFPAARSFPCLRHPVATPALVRMIRTSSDDHETAPRDDQPTADPAAFQNTVRVGGYELIAEIARGGMGAVFVCRRTGESGFQRLFAMKILHPHLAALPRFVAMLLDEARVASRIHHPNVAAVVDVGHDDANHYVVMDYVEGGSLALLRRRARVCPPELVIPILVNALEGLHAAHVLEDDSGTSIGLVHRDVSPQNILVGSDGIGRIADFGIAKARSRLEETEAGTRKGKLIYMAPEQIIDAEGVDPRVDVFASGAVLWWLLTGKVLFHGSNEAAVVRNILDKPISAPSTQAGDVVDYFDAICLKALERDPNNRFQSCIEMADALRAAAMANNCWGTPSAIGAWVKEVLGNEIADRRRAIRLAARASSDTIISSELGTPTVLATALRETSEGFETAIAPAKPEPEPARKRVAWLPVVVTAAVCLGIGSVAWIAMRSPDSAAETRAVSPDSTAPGGAAAQATPASASRTAEAGGVTTPDGPTPEAPSEPAGAPEPAPAPAPEPALDDTIVIDDQSDTGGEASDSTDEVEAGPFAEPRTAKPRRRRPAPSPRPATPPEKPPPPQTPLSEIEANPYQ